MRVLGLGWPQTQPSAAMSTAVGVGTAGLPPAVTDAVLASGSCYQARALSAGNSNRSPLPQAFPGPWRVKRRPATAVWIVTFMVIPPGSGPSRSARSAIGGSRSVTACWQYHRTGEGQCVIMLCCRPAHPIRLSVKPQRVIDRSDPRGEPGPVGVILRSVKGRRDGSGRGSHAGNAARHEHVAPAADATCGCYGRR